jgi:hypothetical protein
MTTRISSHMARGHHFTSAQSHGVYIKHGSEPLSIHQFVRHALRDLPTLARDRRDSASRFTRPRCYSRLEERHRSSMAFPRSAPLCCTDAFDVVARCSSGRGTRWLQSVPHF